MIRKLVGAALAATAAGVAVGYVYDWWQECRFELFDPMWIERARTCCCGTDVGDPNEPCTWCPVHGDPELGSLVVRD